MISPVLLLLAFVPSTLTLAKGTGDNIFATCQEHLRDADIDKSGQINRTEYIILINHYTGGSFSDVKDFDMLPLSLQANFVNLACLCGMLGGNAECCTGDRAHLLVPEDVDDGEEHENEWFFEEVCNDTHATIASVVTDNVPTSTPASTTAAAAGDVDLASLNVTATSIPSAAPSSSTMFPSAAPAINGSSTDNDLQYSEVEERVRSGDYKAAVPSSSLPWRKQNRRYFIPIVLLSCCIVVAFGFSLVVVFRRRYQYGSRKDPQGFILGSFPQLQTTSTLTTDWCANGFVANSLDDQDCNISYEYSGYESDTGSRVSLRSIHVPLRFSRPYTHYRYVAHRDTDAPDGCDTSHVSPMSSEQGSEQGSIHGTSNESPLPVRRFGGDHFTM